MATSLSGFFDSAFGLSALAEAQTQMLRLLGRKAMPCKDCRLI